MPGEAAAPAAHPALEPAWSRVPRRFLALLDRPPTAFVSGALFVVLGMSTGALGVSWPSIGAAADASFQDLVGPLAFSTAVYSAFSIATGLLMRRVGPPWLLLTGTVAAGAGLGFSTVAGSISTILVSVGLVGGGSGMINAAVNVHATLAGGPRRPAYLHALWAIGAMLGPGLIATTLATFHRWQYAFVGLAIAFIAAAAVVLGTYDRWGLPEGQRRSPGERLLSRPAAYCAVALPFAYVGLEVSTGHWAFLQLLGSNLMSWTGASIALTLFWTSLLGGRLLLALAADRLKPPAALKLSLIATCAGSLAFWWWADGVAALLILPVMGLGLSVVLPTLFKLTRDRFGDERSGPVIACQVAAGTLGGLLCPTLIGVLMRWQGLDMLKPCLFGLAFAMGLLYVGATRLSPAVSSTRG